MIVGHRKGAISYVGTDRIEGLDSAKLPASLEALDATEIIRDYVVRGSGVVPKRRPAVEARVALVTVWDVPCGIAAYSADLYGELVDRVADIHVFAEREGDLEDTATVTRCWDRGESLAELTRELVAYAPDAIIVQHEYGNFPRADHWLAFMSSLMDYHVITALHSVYAHLDKTVVEAACSNIVVHTDGAMRMLRSKGISGPVRVIPHGCHVAATRDKLWNLYATPHTILQHGFGFSYKGWENAIRTVAALRPTYPDVFYTGLMSERWAGDHAGYQRQLYALAEELEVADRVGLIRGWQASTVLDAFLRVNQVALFPYIDNGEHTVYGCSGAARAAMVAGVPVVTSHVPLFEDLDGIVPQPSDVAGWAAAITTIFEGGRDVALQDEFLAAHTWEMSGSSYLDLISR